MFSLMGYQLFICIQCSMCNAEGFCVIMGCLFVNTSVMTTATQTVNTKSQYPKASVLASFQIKKITF